ncbi:hypothetical protein TTHERM_01207730 (macronuclear) [Tetrahymena thermophila SB210]|uniref:Uncharacterized protein n=1 Tax=Tetrahymena thermophila (strain SB210) TaxID=312017 RepID=Q23YP9_TETTS|nr:hypothetical protein TTHERM_01207730 [Tetrahymena thermophila SB210]EAS01673.2 hypothetical protein TTHERM_01207730 [Tetrahymena thermophila SB210]|eukprot:XP_001021918.2 hypothetical protein TTHERM_01207730 [Tetrahymena thermophila SB210]
MKNIQMFNTQIKLQLLNIKTLSTNKLIKTVKMKRASKQNKGKRGSSKNDRCNYRMIDDADKHEIRQIQQYNNYMSLFRFNSKVKIEEIYDKCDEISIEPESENISQVNKNEINDGVSEEQNELLQVDIKLFLEKSKQNIYKNIINAFYRHIHTLKDTMLQKIYEALTKDKWQFSYIALRVYQNLKGCGRFSLKIKNLLTSPNLKNIFLFFLQNADDFWIKDSKIKNKEQLLKSISLIITAYENDCDFLLSHICYYKKQKKLTCD